MSTRVTRKGPAARAAVTEYEYEPVPGLPERLPPGERILWQAAPRWDVLARRAFHVRKVAIYFLIVAALTLAWDLRDGRGVTAALVNLTWLALAVALAIGLLLMLARSMAHATLYTITNRRLVMRFGVAIPMTINLPYDKVTGAALRENGDGTGDIPITLARSSRVPYWVLWPHTRPWRFAPAEPMLRAVPDVASVARTLATALESFASDRGEQPQIERADPGMSRRPSNRPGSAAKNGQDGARGVSLTSSGAGIPAH